MSPLDRAVLNGIIDEYRCYFNQETYCYVMEVSKKKYDQIRSYQQSILKDELFHSSSDYLIETIQLRLIEKIKSLS